MLWFRRMRWVRGGLLISAAFAGGAVFGQFSLASTRQDDPYASLTQLGRVLAIAENHYVEPVDHAKIVEGAIKGMMRELDPHSTYMPPEDFRVFQSETEGRFVGIGVEVDIRDDAITVIAPIEGSPAERAGILSGDRIVSVDGQPVRGEPLEKLVQKLRGAPGTRVRIALRRAGAEAPISIELTRQTIRVSSVSARRLDGDIGYVRVKQFQDGTHKELLDALGKLRSETKSPLVGFVLDLRNNPGGLVDEATQVADEFLDGGTIFSTRHRGQTVEQMDAHRGGAAITERVAVLVNEYSASASELLAGALQDNRRAAVVGVPTFGKGSVQTIVELPGGAGLKLTTMRYYTPSGRSIQAQGIAPEVLLESPSSPTEAVGITRERDLEGHLPAEEQRAASARPVVRVPVPAPKPADARASTAVPPRKAEDVPANPVGGQDAALAVAYQMLRGAITLGAKP